MPRITKEEAELTIFERFIAAFERRFGYSLVDVEHDDKPDFRAVDPTLGEPIGIEITGAYQDPTEARIQYWDIDKWGKLIGSIDDLVENINTRLEDKAAKSWEYDFEGRLVLGIWIGSLVFNEKIDMDMIRNRLFFPENAFSNIWLIVKNRQDGSSELYDLK